MSSPEGRAPTRQLIVITDAPIDRIAVSVTDAGFSELRRDRVAYEPEIDWGTLSDFQGDSVTVTVTVDGVALSFERAIDDALSGQIYVVHTWLTNPLFEEIGADAEEAAIARTAPACDDHIGWHTRRAGDHCWWFADESVECHRTDDCPRGTCDDVTCMNNSCVRMEVPSRCDPDEERCAARSHGDDGAIAFDCVPMCEQEPEGSPCLPLPVVDAALEPCLVGPTCIGRQCLFGLVDEGQHGECPALQVCLHVGLRGRRCSDCAGPCEVGCRMGSWATGAGGACVCELPGRPTQLAVDAPCTVDGPAPTEGQPVCGSGTCRADGICEPTTVCSTGAPGTCDGPGTCVGTVCEPTRLPDGEMCELAALGDADLRCIANQFECSDGACGPVFLPAGTRVEWTFCRQLVCDGAGHAEAETPNEGRACGGGGATPAPGYFCSENRCVAGSCDPVLLIDAPCQQAPCPSGASCSCQRAGEGVECRPS